RGKKGSEKRLKRGREGFKRENRLLPTELRHEALALQRELEFDFETPGEPGNSSQDDEYKWAGLEPPKVMVTTSRDPSARLRLFAKVCGARNGCGSGVGVALGWVCQCWGVTPMGVGVASMWAWPQCGRGLNVGVAPKLLTRGEGWGQAWITSPCVGTILKHLFPVPRPDSRRVVTFANEDDVILVRNHVYRRRGRSVELEEVGPRFQLRPYLIRLGTLEQGDAADVEWRWHPYTATAPKRRLLSNT
uniref:IMP U3 small nucleolar ribonucleoprotein 4 n=1 Tax=Zosterops lateralis melanops TaxID=1220523 RepID=A0A8D2QTB8_ZOSLA